MMRELARVGIEWDTSSAKRERINDRRKALYQALDGRVPHRVIAEVAGSTKGAVEQALTKMRVRGEFPGDQILDGSDGG
jgi:hypothetical protein